MRAHTQNGVVEIDDPRSVPTACCTFCSLGHECVSPCVEQFHLKPCFRGQSFPVSILSSFVLDSYRLPFVSRPLFCSFILNFFQETFQVCSFSGESMFTRLFPWGTSGFATISPSTIKNTQSLDQKYRQTLNKCRPQLHPRPQQM